MEAMAAKKGGNRGPKFSRLCRWPAHGAAVPCGDKKVRKPMRRKGIVILSVLTMIIFTASVALADSPHFLNAHGGQCHRCLPVLQQRGQSPQGGEQGNRVDSLDRDGDVSREERTDHWNHLRWTSEPGRLRVPFWAIVVPDRGHLLGYHRHRIGRRLFGRQPRPGQRRPLQDWRVTALGFGWDGLMKINF